MHAHSIVTRTVCAAGVVLASCTALFAATAPSSTPPIRAPLGQHRSTLARGPAFTTPIQHVVVIVQENRTVDNLFNGFPGADSVTVDPVTGFSLKKCSLYEKAEGCPPGSGHNTACDPSHMHEPLPPPSTQQGFSVEYNGGNMDGFQQEHGSGCTKAGLQNVAYSYVPPYEVTQYWGFASSYAFVNHALQTNNGPSFPSHQYLIAGQAGGLLSNGMIDTSFPWSIDENTTVPRHKKGGTSYTSCLTPTAWVTALNLTTAYPGTEAPETVHPCGTYPTIFDEAQAAGLSWKYYASNETGLWGGPSAVNQDCMGINPSGKACNNTNIVPCSPQALADFLNIGSKGLADVTYVIPNGAWSDHAVTVSPDSKVGPNWVTWLVDSIGKSSYWKTTTIIVTWDDWGGWFDHYQPGGTPGLGLLNCATNGSLATPASCGFRVPIIVIGPYVKAGYIDTADTNAAGAILLYIEHTFGLSTLTPRGSNALGTADDWTSDDLMNTMAFGNAPAAFKPQPKSTPSAYYTSSSCVDPSDEDD